MIAPRSVKSDSAGRSRICRYAAVLTVSSWLVFSSFDSLSSQERAHRIASYEIEVKLDTENRELSGKEILTFKNTSEKSVDTLFLHLYPNAFRSDSTIFMKESLLPDRVKKEEERNTGHIWKSGKSNQVRDMI